MGEYVYLRNITKVEPLIAGWYAWCHLASPVQLALNMAYRYAPSLRSFIANAAVHEAASKNPKNLGGSFMELTREDLPAVKKLFQETQDKLSHLYSFADDLFKLDRRLQDESGHSLDRLYDDLPPTLAGMVEVSYDINHHPSMRVLEELAHSGGLSSQLSQEVSFTRVRDEKRNFFLNTPRLATSDRMIVSIPFADQRIDLLSRARIEAVEFTDLANALGVPEEAYSHFRDYFTDEAPVRKEPEYRGDDVRIRYFGHACVLIQTAQTSVLVDPFLTWDDYDSEDHLSFDDLPDHIDYVFLTHNHEDHFNVELLLQLRSRIGCILVPRNNPNCMADPSMRLALKALGFDRVKSMDWMDSIAIPDGTITSVPSYGEHSDINISSKHGMHLSIKGRSFLFLADSDCKDRKLYQRIASVLGDVDTIFIGMECVGAPLTWMYGCYLSKPISRKDDESRRLAGSDAARASAFPEIFNCKNIYVYAMGQEPWMTFACGPQFTSESKQLIESNKFVSACQEAGLVAERLFGCKTFYM